MSKYAGTRTEKNLLAAFAGESQARNKYVFFSAVAKGEGNEDIAKIFERPPATRSSTPRCGSRSWAGSVTAPPT